MSHGGWSELWHARLVTRAIENGEPVEPSIDAPAPLRALWAEGFDPAETLTANDLFAGEPGIGRAAMAAVDRKQIVALTSAFHDYISVDERSSEQSTFEPTPIQCERLMLSPLGGWLKSHGEWDPPCRRLGRAADPPFDWQTVFRREPVEAEHAMRIDPQALKDHPFVPGLGGEPGPPLNLSQWVHVASQGRDHYVRVVYDGCLCGTDHPASLVKVTERRFCDVNGTAVAYLVQYMYVVVRQPEVDYSTRPIAHDGRSLPFTRIRLTTTVTPPIDDPAGASAVGGGSSSFWVMVTDPATGKLVDFVFHGVATDLAGHRWNFTGPLMFVPSGEQHLDLALAAYFNDGGGRRRAFSVSGQMVTYAAPDPTSAADNTTFATEAILLAASPSAQTSCGFVPALDTADVRIPAVEQLLGVNTVTSIALNQSFLDTGFVGGTGVFADIRSGLGIKFDASQAGGIATPNLNLSCLSRDHGPLAGDIGKAAAGAFDPGEFFPKGTAQLFGVVDLLDLLPAGTIADNAPKLVTVRENGGKKIVTTIDWQPAMGNPDPPAGPLTFHREPDSTLIITGRIEQIVGTSPTPPATRMHGELTNFSIEFAEVVHIGFAAFDFTSENGRKPSIDVRLKPDDPIAFLGALAFIDELRKHIPPGLFGDGPSLDINATRIRAGFGIALPPLSVAVFALRNVSLNTALELPFSSGQPALDFGFSERHHPFQLAVALLGGGGFFHLQVDTAGIRQLEAALEFGAVAALDLFVASGSVHIMAGIYFAMNRNAHGDLAAMLSGYLRCGGELSVLGIISISVEFNLSFTYDDGTKKASGRATLSVEVEIAFFSKSIELTVERSFGRDGGDPTFEQLVETPAVWGEYAGAFA
ncbi:hypothetical protein [Paraburkholderia hospita]|uniref:hypothetical protein n=1 Tax=Paraburkholderia hospita TaxID=169430 RepID=UPI001ABEF82C|nr:hypothetical protein [Paraburkholderia hospita]